MPDDKLTSIFDACMRGEGPDGWVAESGLASDTLTSPGLLQTTWTRPNEKVDRPWTKVPRRAVEG